ncbi:vesicular acetylcholine transporter-like [Amphiura filiformis]|uniref:vesicular acetylcholine transporter-like n=1 Tax=Amphiura filiformis TaxID=82378 RepID=UPI003B22615A
MAQWKWTTLNVGSVQTRNTAYPSLHGNWSTHYAEFGNHASFTVSQTFPPKSDESPDQMVPESNAIGSKVDSRMILVYMALPVMSLITSPITGSIGDAFGFDVPLLAALGASIVLTNLYAFSVSFVAVFVSQLLQGFACAASTPNIFGKVYSLYPLNTDEGKTILGVIMACSAFNFFGPAIGGILYAEFGQKAAFLSFVPLEIFLVLCILVTFQSEIKRSVTKNEVNENIDVQIDENATPLLHTEPKNKGVKLTDIIKDHKVVLLSLTLTACALPKVCIQYVLAIWMEDRFNSDATTTGLFLGTAGVTEVAANVISVKFNNRYPEHICMYTALHVALCALPSVLLPFVPSPITGSFCFAFYIYFTGSARYGTMSMLSGLAENEYQTAYGRVIGVGNLGFTLPYLASPFVAVPLFNAIGFKKMCIIIGMVPLVWAPFLFFVRNAGKSKPSIPDDLSITPLASPVIQTSSAPVQPRT